DARAAIRRVRRQNPEARIVVTGCYAQRAPEEIAALAGVSAVVGNSHKHQVAEIAARLIGNVGGNGLRVAVTDDVEAEELNGSPNLVPLAQLSGLEIFPEAKATLVGDIFAHTQLLAA